MNKPTTALVDGDIVVFKAAFANQSTENGVITPNPVHYAYKTAKDILQSILKETECTEMVVFLSDREHSNFRYKVAKTQPYKENRKEKARPVHEQAVRNYLIEKWNATLVKGAEADDAMGIQQDKENGSTIICSIDKDLDMIPGWHYDFDVGRTRKVGDRTIKMKSYKKKAIYYVKDPGFLALRKVNGKNMLVGAGQLWFCAQMLLGDSTDNIPGLEGYGQVKVYKTLEGCKTYREAMRKVYLCYSKSLLGLTSNDVIARIKEIAQLLWIKRDIKETIFKLEEIIK